jgi:hypothetical protein
VQLSRLTRTWLLGAMLATACADAPRAPAASPNPAAPPAPPPAAPPAPASIPDRIELRAPLPDAIVQSPLVIEGRARGNWFFEASFPVYLLSAEGDTLAVRPAQAAGEWMTEAFVPFKVTLAFTPPASATGTLVLARDNPSGLPEHAAELRVPVRFR